MPSSHSVMPSLSRARTASRSLTALHSSTLSLCGPLDCFSSRTFTYIIRTAWSAEALLSSSSSEQSLARRRPGKLARVAGKDGLEEPLVVAVDGVLVEHKINQVLQQPDLHLGLAPEEAVEDEVLHVVAQIELLGASQPFLHGDIVHEPGVQKHLAGERGAHLRPAQLEPHPNALSVVRLAVRCDHRIFHAFAGDGAREVERLHVHTFHCLLRQLRKEPHQLRERRPGTQVVGRQGRGHGPHERGFKLQRMRNLLHKARHEEEMLPLSPHPDARQGRGRNQVHEG
eukprot:scaffold1188_cov255-Pinguiococcus_pyrenoidosus.AAC.11